VRVAKGMSISTNRREPHKHSAVYSTALLLPLLLLLLHVEISVE
jgi:hypothetical protein